MPLRCNAMAEGGFDKENTEEEKQRWGWNGRREWGREIRERDIRTQRKLCTLGVYVFNRSNQV